MKQGGAFPEGRGAAAQWILVCARGGLQVAGPRRNTYVCCRRGWGLPVGEAAPTAVLRGPRALSFGITFVYFFL